MNGQGKLVVVTGCSGRIGSCVTTRFGNAGYNVVGFDIVPPKRGHEQLDYQKIDLTSDESVKNGFDYIRKTYGNRITSVIHLAAYYSFAGEHPELYDIITVNGTRRIIQACQSFDCDQFLFSSTQLIYAPCKAVEDKINEDSPIVAQWDYPLSKVKAEKVIHDEKRNIKSVILRIAGCYDDECHSIPISNQIQRIYEKQLTSRLFPGNITHGNPFLHMDDLTEAIWQSVQRCSMLPSELALIIGEGATMSYDELQREISQQLFGKPIKTFRIPKFVAKFGAWAQNHTPFMEETFIKPWMIDVADCHYALDVSKAYDALGWEPRHFVKDTIPLMTQFLKNDPVEFYKTNGLIMPEWLKKKVA